ncbi:hypothetical protein trd_0925 [Thermomicrobium roseum DSM 5159]|uniref:Uncharacterized protein n=1 Tax=Thermomicrobium roseum (strain ATCC 27502 / DSM 5159 / P-2) TaxID=309801 RepID=B9KZT1_THERP|nr:hypothetical protein trd_0925 [Thermomicrobium roseum DSM 5159]
MSTVSKSSEECPWLDHQPEATVPSSLPSFYRERQVFQLREDAYPA